MILLEPTAGTGSRVVDPRILSNDVSAILRFLSVTLVSIQGTSIIALVQVEWPVLVGMATDQLADLVDANCGSWLVGLVVVCLVMASMLRWWLV